MHGIWNKTLKMFTQDDRGLTRDEEAAISAKLCRDGQQFHLDVDEDDAELPGEVS